MTFWKWNTLFKKINKWNQEDLPLNNSHWGNNSRMYFNKKVSDSSKMSWDALIKQESGNFTETGNQWSSEPGIKKTLFISSNHGFRFTYIWFCQQIQKPLSLRPWMFSKQYVFLKGKRKTQWFS